MDKAKTNQAQLDRQVANVTGDDISTIAQMGFSVLGPNRIEERAEPLIVDWDAVDRDRHRAA